MWLPDKLSRQMTLFDARPDLGLVYSDAYYQTPDGKRWRSFQIDRPVRGRIFEALLRQNFILCLTAVVPRDVLQQVGDFRPDYYCGEDYDLFLRIARAFEVDFVDTPLAIYRVHGDNFSRRLDVRYGEWLRILTSYGQRADVQASKAMVNISWGLEAWRQNGEFAALFRLLQGLLQGLSHPQLFYRAMRAAWEKKMRAKLLTIR